MTSRQGRILYRVNKNGWYIHEINNKQFQIIIVLVITRYPREWLFLNTVLFSLIWWPTSRDTALYKNERWNQAGPLFTIVNCVDDCSWIGPFCFHLSLFKWLYHWMQVSKWDAVKFTVFKTNYSSRWYSLLLVQFDLVYLKKYFFRKEKKKTKTIIHPVMCNYLDFGIGGYFMIHCNSNKICILA